MNLTSILICRDPLRTEWQLGRLPPASGLVTLIGWTQAPHPVNAGVPEDVAGVLARALTSVGRVTFPSSVLHPSLVSTTGPATLMRAFDDPGYPWWLQGQILLISALNAPPPNVERARFLAVFEADLAAAADLAPAGIIGIVRAGVDGEVAGLLSLSAGFDDTCVAALEREARQASFEWLVVSEEVFALRLGNGEVA